MKKRRVHIAIMKAAEIGHGIHLSADEVRELAQDSSHVFDLAVGSLTTEEMSRWAHNMKWSRITP